MAAQDSAFTPLCKFADFELSWKKGAITWLRGADILSSQGIL